MLGYKKKLILREREFKRQLPVNLSSDDAYHFDINLKYTCPDLFIYFFKHVYLLPDSTLFLHRIWPLAISFPYYKKRIRHHSMKGIIDIQRSWRNHEYKKAVKHYLIIHDQWTLNYYHWMTQALPRLLIVLKAKIPFVLLLPINHCEEFHVKTLKILGVANWVSFEVDKNYYGVSDLIYPSHDIQIGDYHDDLMVELSSVLKKNIVKAEKSYLFVHRVSKSTRKMINEDEVLSTFLTWGFQIIDFEKLSFEDQRMIAGKATILAGVHGAGLSNMLFMEKGSKVLELTSILNGEQYYYYTLSSALGHNYYYQICKPLEEGKSIQETNFLVDIERLNKNIERMMSSND